MNDRISVRLDSGCSGSGGRWLDHIMNRTHAREATIVPTMARINRIVGNPIDYTHNEGATRHRV